MRNNTIDIARGIAFGCMLVHHVFYFTNMSRPIDMQVNLSRPVEVFGSVARHLFILIAGYSIAAQYLNQTEKCQTWKKRLSRCIEVGFHAGLISLVSYACYPSKWVRFGILHFMCLASLLASTIMLSVHSELIALCVIVGLFCAPITGTFLDVVSGSQCMFSTIDWFPLASWFPLLWLGVLLGRHFPPSKLFKGTNENGTAMSIFSFVGKNSLTLYTTHFVLFCVLSKYRTLQLP